MSTKCQWRSGWGTTFHVHLWPLLHCRESVLPTRKEEEEVGPMGWAAVRANPLNRNKDRKFIFGDLIDLILLEDLC